NAGDGELAGATAWGEPVGGGRASDRAAGGVGGWSCGVIGGGHLGGALDGAVGGALGDHRRGGVIDGDRLGAGGAVAAGIGGGVKIGRAACREAAARGEHVGAVRDGDRAAAVVGGQHRGV